jgi:hypothetical protein
LLFSLLSLLKDHRGLQPLELVGSEDVAEKLGGCRVALGDEHLGARVEVVERVDIVGGGAKGKGREDGDAIGLDGADD